jgi:hypothetical protein
MTRVIEHLSGLSISCKNGDTAEIAVIERHRLIGTISHEGANLRDPVDPKYPAQFVWRADGTLADRLSDGHALDPKALASARQLAQGFLKLVTLRKRKWYEDENLIDAHEACRMIEARCQQLYGSPTVSNPHGKLTYTDKQFFTAQHQLEDEGRLPRL